MKYLYFDERCRNVRPPLSQDDNGAWRCGSYLDLHSARPPYTNIIPLFSSSYSNFLSEIFESLLRNKLKGKLS